MSRVEVLFEDEYCLVLNKPAGLAVQGGEGVGASLDELLAAEWPTRPLLVHRLDKDTSGVILVAKNREAAARFSALFAGEGTGERGIVKQYVAVCAGLPRPAEGSIDLDLEIRGAAKESHTSYRTLGSGTLDATGERDYALLELELGTGRMHQIRRHLAKIGHPVLGDDKYGNFSLNKELRKAMGLKRLLLHASRLCVPPGIDVSAPLPDYFGPYTRTGGTH
jgi:23S rRNA pseudouridine955/2504/2580 synthase